MSVQLTDSDEDYLTAYDDDDDDDDKTMDTTASKDEIPEMPECSLQRPQDDKNITANEDEKQEVPGRRLPGQEVASGRSYSIDCPDDCNDIRLLLVGKTGHGKSATGNSILGLQKGHHEAFLEKLSAVSVTRDAELKNRKRFGRRIEVVDCPGFCDTRLTDLELRVAIVKAIALTMPGFTAIGFVLKPERFSDELIRTIELFIHFFGNNVQKFAFIILTHMDNKESANEYFRSGSKSLQKLKSFCTGREIVTIDNGCKDIKQKDKQVHDIIDAVVSIAQANGNTCYSNKMFEEATRFALEFAQAHNVKNADVKANNQNVKEMFEHLKIEFARDTTGTFSGFYKHVSNGTVFKNAFSSLYEGLKNGDCSIL